ncbi:penicillin-binding protein [Candidatus Uhrbacteria bacterium]|jgi:1A family penicillin-binding protein|nr:penicillin-binding protein [Candidatus Uhrbacteria bacterium]
MNPKSSRHQTWKSGNKRRRKPGKKLSSFLKGMNKKTLIKNILLGCVALALFGSILFLGAFAWLSKDLPDPNSLTIREIPQSTKIYDNTGEHLLYEIAGAEKRTLVTLDQIPEYVVWATITAEDRKFYEHGGIDIKGIMRAIFIDVVTLSRAQGASTITQQLVKNAILTNEKTFTRKFKEVILSLALERRYTKDEIMQLYLNEIPYGSRNYGIQSASDSYYGLAVEELSLAQAATLASLPKAPTTYLNNPDQLETRRNWILQSMADLEHITQDEADIAMAEDTTISIEYNDIEAPHFVLWVKEQLEETYGQLQVEQGGLRVTTTIDYDKQVLANEAVTANAEARSESYGFNNSGLVSMDPDNGHILAMVGSVDYNDDEIDGKVNIAMSSLQPGSSFKPIIYTAAFERGYTPNTILWDVLTTFVTATGNYQPNNYDLEEHGPVTVRSALQGSLNIPAVKMLYLVGIEEGMDFAQRLGYSTLTDPSTVGLSMVLGGAEVTLLDHTAAYATLASEGVYHEPVSILMVKDSAGEILEEWRAEEHEGEKVLEANIARMISDVLSDNNARTPYFGASSYLALSGRPAAAKTGTTNDYNDAWTMGYTPSLVAGVWTGNTDGTTMNRGSGGSSVAAPVWNQYMNAALAGQAAEGFVSPEIPITGIAMLDGEIPSELVVLDKASGKLATERTPESYIEEKFCGDYHTILHYISPSDPLTLVDEPTDSSYVAWEANVQEYLVRSNEELEEGEVAKESCDIPEDKDDLHVKSNEPDIDIDEPSNHDEVDRSFRVDIDADAKRGIDRVTYWIDDVFVKQSSSKSGTTLSLPSWVEVGEHTLKVVAYDDIDNASEDKILIEVTEAGDSSQARITNPFASQEIEQSNDTYQIAVEIAGASDVSEITLTALNLWTGEETLITTVESPSSVIIVEWSVALEGDYSLSGVTTGNDEETADISPVLVSVRETLTAPDLLDLVPEEEAE